MEPHEAWGAIPITRLELSRLGVHKVPDAIARGLEGAVMGTVRGRAAGAEPLLTRQFMLACVVHFTAGMGLSFYILFPLFLRKLGASDLAIGLYSGAMGAAAVLARLPVGRLLDTKGRRHVLIGAGLLHAASWVGFLWIDSLGALALLLVLLHGLAAGALFGSLFTYASDIVPVTRRAEGIAMFGIWGMLPNGLGPLCAEWLIDTRGFNAFFAAASILALSSVLVTWFLPETSRRSSGAAGTGQLVLPALDLRSLAHVLCVTFAFGIAVNSVFTFLAPFADAHGRGGVASFFMAYSLTAVAIRILGGTLPDRLGLRRVLLPALLVLAAGIAAVPHVGAGLGFIATGALCGAGHGYAFPILTVLAADSVELPHRGRAVSWFTAMFDLGTTIGNPILGGIAEAAGYTAMFTAAAAGVLAAGVAVWRRR